MVWYVKALERKGKDGKPLGLWHLCADSDEDGGFHPGCSHDHASAEEAQNCVEANIHLGKITGFPYRPADIDRAALEKKAEELGIRFFSTPTDANLKHAVESQERVAAALAGASEKKIKHMVDRFLRWKLPADFNPDGGISFKRDFNENTAHPMKHEPSGTNLLNAKQADEMVRFIIEGLDKE